MTVLVYGHKQVVPPSGGGTGGTGGGTGGTGGGTGGTGGGTGGTGGGTTPPPPPIATPSDPPIVIGSAAVSVRALATSTVEVNVSYNVGQTATTKCTFRVGRTPIDPPSVVLTLTTPSGVAQAVTGGFLHDSVGEYLYDFTAASRGAWTVTWVGSGTITDENGHVRTYTAVESKRVRVS